MDDFPSCSRPWWSLNDTLSLKLLQECDWTWCTGDLINQRTVWFLSLYKLCQLVTYHVIVLQVTHLKLQFQPFYYCKHAKFYTFMQPKQAIMGFWSVELVEIVKMYFVKCSKCVKVLRLPTSFWAAKKFVFICMYRCVRV